MTIESVVAGSYSESLRRISEIQAAGNNHEARGVAENAIVRFPKVIRVRDQLTALSDSLGDVERALAVCVQTAKIQVKRLEKQRLAENRPLRSLDENSRVFICGYFYSGSGAVFDYLRDFPGMKGWTPAGEMRLIKFPGGMWDLVSRCKAQQGLDAQALVDFYLHIKGKKLLTHGPGVYSSWGKVNQHSRGLWKKDGARYYLEVCLRCFLELHRHWRKKVIKVKWLKGFFREYLRQAFDAAATENDASHLIIDQAINAFRLELAALAPASKFIVVHRDPRDQFVDAAVALSRPGRKLPTAEEFSITYRERRDKGLAAIQSMEEKCGHRFLTMSFEDFVVNFSQAHRLVDNFLEITDMRRTGDFSIERSRVNVGKYREVLSEDQAAVFFRNNRDAISEYVTHAGVFDGLSSA